MGRYEKHRKTCVRCGREYLATRTDSRTCGARCRQLLSRAERRDRVLADACQKGLVSRDLAASLAILRQGPW